MGQVGIRELKQRASEVLRRVEEGESYVVTVQGREVAELTPARIGTWRTWDQVADVLTGPPDPQLLDDISELGGEIHDPWADD